MRRKKVKWPVEKRFHRKLKHEVDDWIMTLPTEEKFKENDLEPLEKEVYFCEPENGIFFDEEGEDGKKRQDEDLVSYLTSSEQPEDWIAKTSNEKKESYVFNINTCGNVEWKDEMLKANEYQREDLKTETSSKAKKSKCFETNTLCVFTSTKNEEGQLVDVVIKNEGKGHNLNSVLRENGDVESHVHTYV